MKSKIQNLFDLLKRFNRKPYNTAFKAILLSTRIQKVQKAYDDDRIKYSKSFQETINGKDSELHEYKRKVEEFSNANTSAKARENEISAKIKNREKQIQALEAERDELLKAKKSNPDMKVDIRALEEQLLQLQIENEELREKHFSAEDNVESFIKEMSDLLDTHELSTNLISDNTSFNNHEHEEEFIKHKKQAPSLQTQQPAYYEQPQKHSSKENIKVAPQNNPKPASSKGYPRNQQINFCFIEYDDPVLVSSITTSSTSLPLTQIPTIPKSIEQPQEAVVKLPELDSKDYLEMFFPMALDPSYVGDGVEKQSDAPKIMMLPPGGKKESSDNRGSRKSGGTSPSPTGKRNSKEEDRSPGKKKGQKEEDEEGFDEE